MNSHTKRCRICYEGEREEPLKLHERHNPKTFHESLISFFTKIDMVIGNYSFLVTMVNYIHKFLKMSFGNVFTVNTVKYNTMDPKRCPGKELIQPCKCIGSMAYVHRDCLNSWRFSTFISNINQCFEVFHKEGRHLHFIDCLRISIDHAHYKSLLSENINENCKVEKTLWWDLEDYKSNNISLFWTVVDSLINLDGFRYVDIDRLLVLMNQQGSFSKERATTTAVTTTTTTTTEFKSKIAFISCELCHTLYQFHPKKKNQTLEKRKGEKCKTGGIFQKLWSSLSTSSRKRYFVSIFIYMVLISLTGHLLMYFYLPSIENKWVSIQHPTHQGSIQKHHLQDLKGGNSRNTHHRKLVAQFYPQGHINVSQETWTDLFELLKAAKGSRAENNLEFFNEYHPSLSSPSSSSSHRRSFSHEPSNFSGFSTSGTSHKQKKESTHFFEYLNDILYYYSIFALEWFLKFIDYFLPCPFYFFQALKCLSIIRFSFYSLSNFKLTCCLHVALMLNLDILDIFTTTMHSFIIIQGVLIIWYELAFAIGMISFYYLNGYVDELIGTNAAVDYKNYNEQPLYYWNITSYDEIIESQ